MKFKTSESSTRWTNLVLLVCDLQGKDEDYKAEEIIKIKMYLLILALPLCGTILAGLGGR